MALLCKGASALVSSERACAYVCCLVVHLLPELDHRSASYSSKSLALSHSTAEHGEHAFLNQPVRNIHLNVL